MSKVIRYNLDKFLSNNLCEYLLSTVSNMLAFEFETRNTYTTTIEHYSISCAKRIKIKILDQVFLEEDFAIALNLFIIAISPEDIYAEDITNKINQNISKDSLTAVIASNLSGNQNLIDITQNLVSNDKNLVEKINFIASQSHLISDLDKEKTKDIESNIDQYCKIDNQVKSTISVVKNFFSMLGTLSLAVGLMAVGVAILGPLSSIAIIPSALVGLKYGGKIGEAIANKITLTKNHLNKNQIALDKIKRDFSKFKRHAVHKEQKKIEKKESVQKKDVSHHVKQDIITSLSKHINDNHDKKIPKSIVDDKIKKKEKAF